MSKINPIDTRTDVIRPRPTVRSTWPMRALAACTALVVGMSALAVQAQPRNERHDQRQGQRQDERYERRQGQRHDQRHDQRPHQAQRHSGPHLQERRQGPPPQAYRSGPPPQAYRPGPPPFAQGPGRGVGPDHRWHRGDRLPPAYRSYHYVVNDWRGHHLHAPPRGYHWVQYGADYILVAIATGLIVQIVLSQ